MKTILVNLPSDEELKTARLPLGLIMIGTVLKQNNYPVNICDLNNFSPLLKKEKKNWFQKSAKLLLRYNPEIVGFTTHNYSLPAALLIAKEYKKIDPKVFVVFGGPGATFAEREILERFPQVDIIVRGEGEKTTLELLAALTNSKSLKGIKGISFREGNQVFRNEDRELISNLSELPFPDYSLFPYLEEYIENEGILYVEGGRGCPYNCLFCSTKNFWKHKFRIKSPSHLAAEMEHLKKIYCKNKNIDISITHDNFFARKETIFPFCNSIKRKKIRWGGTCRADNLSNEALRALKEAGCSRLFVGIESGSKKIQKFMRKNINLSKALDMIRKAAQENIDIVSSYIIGFPSEEEKDINETFKFALLTKLSSENITCIFYPLTLDKGSDLYTLLFKSKKISIASEAISDTLKCPLVSKTKKEANLILKNRDLFCSFFTIKHKLFHADSLYLSCLFFTSLIDFFPKTCYILIDYFNLSPLKMSRVFVKSIKNIKQEVFQHHPKNKAFLKQFLPYFNNFIGHFVEKKESEILNKIFKHESLCIKAKLMSFNKEVGDNGKRKNNTKPDQILQLRKK